MKTVFTQARALLLTAACISLLAGAAQAKSRDELMNEIDAQNNAAQQKLQSNYGLKPKPIPTPNPKPKNDDKKSDSDDSTPQSKAKMPTGDTGDSIDPFADQRWTPNDVKKLCAKQASGPRAYDSCISRNERRIGREKGPYDSNAIGDQ